MKYYLTGYTGGIGSAIKIILQEHEFVGITKQKDIDWLIFAHGMLDEEKGRDTFRVNTSACIELTQKVLPYLRRGVIFISSTSGIKGNTRFPIYSASKAALNSYTETMARKHPELQFYAVCPAATNTKMWHSLGLEGTPQEPIKVAKAVKEIIDGKYKSGDIITVRDGKISV